MLEFDEFPAVVNDDGVPMTTASSRFEDESLMNWAYGYILDFLHEEEENGEDPVWSAYRLSSVLEHKMSLTKGQRMYRVLWAIHRTIDRMLRYFPTSSDSKGGEWI